MFGVFIITAVYMPILALTGVEGKMFHPMAITVIIALVSAMVLSLTFVPAGVALLFRKPPARGTTSCMHAAQSAYQPVLALALRRSMVGRACSTALTLACGWLATRLGTEFIPNLDEGDIAMHALRIPGTSLDQAIRQQQQLEAQVKRLPEVRARVRQDRHGGSRHRGSAAERRGQFHHPEAAR